MAARAQYDGHPVVFDTKNEVWVYEDTGKVAASGERPCKHCSRKPVLVSVIVPAELSHTGEDRRDLKSIDACIADIVRDLNVGVEKPVTAACCCGHGKGLPEIILADGRRLLVAGALED